MANAEHLRHLDNSLVAAVSPFLVESKRQIVSHPQVLVQREILENQRYLPMMGRNGRQVFSIDPNLTSRWLVEPRNQPQESRLATATRTDHHQQLSAGHIEVNGIQGPRTRGKRLGKAANFDASHTAKFRSPNKKTRSTLSSSSRCLTRKIIVRERLAPFSQLQERISVKKKSVKLALNAGVRDQGSEGRQESTT
jgi:hypothetical protein